MKYINFFKTKYVIALSIIFLIVSLFFCFYASICRYGLFFDGEIFILDILDKLADNKPGFFIMNWRTRQSIVFLQDIFVNIAYYIFHIENKAILVNIYCFTLVFLPFSIILLQYILAKRTKRYDIVIFNIILYSLFILPGLRYAVVEIYTSAPLFLLLYHYLCAKIDYKKRDIFFIIFISILLYNFSELIIVCGIIMFFGSLYYIKFENRFKNIAVKLFIGINVLFASVLTLSQNIDLSHYVFSNNNVFEYIFNLIRERKVIYNSYFDIFFILCILILFFFRKKINKPIFIILVFASVFIEAILISYKDLFDPCSIYMLYPYLVIAIIIFYLYLSDLYKKYLHKNILFNISIVSLIIGIIYTVLQIVYSYDISQDIEKFIRFVDKNKSVFVDEKLLKNYEKDSSIFSTYSHGLSYMLYSDDYVIDRYIVTKQKDVPDDVSYIDYKKGQYNVVIIDVALKNKFWDMTPIAKAAKKNPNNYFIK